MSRKKAARPTAGLVLDGSIAIAWCFPDEQDGSSQSILEALAGCPAIVADLWHLEVTNVLLIGERRRRSTQADTVQWLKFLASLPILVDDETGHHAFGDIIPLGRTYNLSAYDAAYLE